MGRHFSKADTAYAELSHIRSGSTTYRAPIVSSHLKLWGSYCFGSKWFLCQLFLLLILSKLSGFPSGQI